MTIPFFTKLMCVNSFDVIQCGSGPFFFFGRAVGAPLGASTAGMGAHGPMNERRRRLVRMAFEKMDKDGNGLLEPSDWGGADWIGGSEKAAAGRPARGARPADGGAVVVVWLVVVELGQQRREVRGRGRRPLSESRKS